MMQRARRQSSRRGYTLMELIVAALISLLVIAGLYVVYAAETRVFRGQEMVSQAQFGVRYAMEVVQADLQRAGFMGVADTDEPSFFQHRCGAPAISPIEAVNVIQHNGKAHHNGGTIVNVTGDVARPPQTNPDELTLVGNFINEESYWVEHIAGNTFTLQNTTTISSTDPFPPDQPTFEQIFRSDNTTLIRARAQEKVFFSVLTGRNYNAAGDSTITVADNPPCPELSGGGGEWAEVNVLHKVRYRVDDPWLTNQENAIKAGVPGINARFDLFREYLDWTDDSVVFREVLAENVVDFQVWFLFDRLENPDTGPLVNHVYDFNLDEDDTGGPPCDTDTIGSHSDCHIKNIHGAVIRLSVRTPHEDPTFLMPPGPRYPLRWYEIDPSSAGAARVRTLITQVAMPNVGSGL